jgi:hypothetical protein
MASRLSREAITSFAGGDTIDTFSFSCLQHCPTRTGSGSG